MDRLYDFTVYKFALISWTPVIRRTGVTTRRMDLEQISLIALDLIWPLHRAILGSYQILPCQLPVNAQAYATSGTAVGKI